MVASPTLVKRRDIACLRGLLLIAFGGILLEAGAVAAGSTALALLIGHGLTTLLLLSTPLHRIRFLKLELVLGVADVIAIGLAIQLAGAAGGALPVSCLMMVLVVALTNRRAHVIGGVAVVAAMHAWLIMGNPDMPTRQLAPHLLFLGSIALYFSYLADGIHNHRKLRDAEELERKELQALLDILGTITSSLDLVVVTRAIVQKLSTVVQTTRCSMLFVNQDKTECFVIASHDDPELEMLETDLSKYPEIREAIETRKPVLIDDVSTDPRMQSVKGVLESLQYQAGTYAHIRRLPPHGQSPFRSCLRLVLCQSK